MLRASSSESGTSTHANGVVGAEASVRGFLERGCWELDRAAGGAAGEAAERREDWAAERTGAPLLFWDDMMSTQEDVSNEP